MEEKEKTRCESCRNYFKGRFYFETCLAGVPRKELTAEELEKCELWEAKNESAESR